MEPLSPEPADDSSSPSPSGSSQPLPPGTPEPDQPAPQRSSLLFRAPTPRPESPDPDTFPPREERWDLPGESLSSPGDDAGSRSGPRSTGSFKKSELREVARAAVRTAGGIVNRLLTRRHTPERDLGLFLADAEDEKAIGDPLAGLASRRLPDGAKNADVIDLIKVAIGIGQWFSKVADRRDEATEIRLQMEPQDEPGTSPADQEDETA